MAGTLTRRPPLTKSPLLADLDHALAALTLALAASGAVLLLFGQAGAGTASGVLGMAAGLAAQMVSRTRAERWVDMVGLLAAFLVAAIGIAQSG